MARRGFSPLRSARRALGTLAARLYLIVCALLLAWSLLAASEESMAAVWPLFATFPAGTVLLFALPLSTVTFYLSIVLGALINALVIGWCALALRRGHHTGTAP
jgi:CBS-domain-containing membrane protein